MASHPEHGKSQCYEHTHKVNNELRCNPIRENKLFPSHKHSRLRNKHLEKRHSHDDCHTLVHRSCELQGRSRLLLLNFGVVLLLLLLLLVLYLFLLFLLLFINCSFICTFYLFISHLDFFCIDQVSVYVLDTSPDDQRQA